MTPPQVIRFDEAHEMLFKIVDAMVSLNILERPHNTMCTGKFLKWLGLSSINHKLIERLKLADTVSRQECEALHISDEVIRILVYCGIVEEVI